MECELLLMSLLAVNASSRQHVQNERNLQASRERALKMMEISGKQDQTWDQPKVVEAIT
jgi:hypothetical protein